MYRFLRLETSFQEYANSLVLHIISLWLVDTGIMISFSGRFHWLSK